METIEKVFNLLTETPEYVSGQKIANELNISRTAVWKAVSSLKQRGFLIEGKTRLGYRYLPSMRLSEDEIRRYLDPALKLTFETYEQIESTNDFCKNLMHDSKISTPHIVLSEQQTCGHGRYGRKFFSPKGGGIYLSILLKTNDEQIDPGLLTIFSSLAAVKALEKLFRINCQLKWVNDIIVDDRKVAGVLVEGATDFQSKTINHVIIGLGMNYMTDPAIFPDDIKFRAGSLRKYAHCSDASRNKLIAVFLNEFFKNYPNYQTGAFMDEYRKRSNIIGKHVSILVSGRVVSGTVKTIDDKGRLVLTDGTVFVSGEVTKIREKVYDLHN